MNTNDQQFLHCGTDEKITDHFIAFLDLLGAKNRIATCENESFEDIRQSYQTAFDTCKKVQELKNVKSAIFSDNIVFALERSEAERKPEALKGFFTLVAAFQETVITYSQLPYGWLLRGGITIGSLSIAPVCECAMVWGKGLVHAHGIESKIAKYPRVVIDNCVVDYFRARPEYMKEVRFRILEDTDGSYFLGYIDPDKACEESLPKHKCAVEKQLENGNPEIKEKLEWLVDYHNWCCCLRPGAEHLMISYPRRDFKEVKF